MSGGHPAAIRAVEPRKQKHDRRDADLLLALLVEERFPVIWLPTKRSVRYSSLIAGTDTLATAGVVRDHALIGQVELRRVPARV